MAVNPILELFVKQADGLGYFGLVMIGLGIRGKHKIVSFVVQLVLNTTFKINQSGDEVCVVRECICLP